MRVDLELVREILDLLQELAGDWEYSGEITSQTRLLADLGLESLDLVVIGTSIQQRYGRLPFSEFLVEIGERPISERDVSVAELVAFVSGHRSNSGADSGGATA